MTGSIYKYTIIILLLAASSLFGIDDVYRFSGQGIEGNTKYQTKRTMCLFPFLNQSGEKNLDYLSTGLPAVLKSSFTSFLYIYDKEPRAEKIQHSYGKINTTPKKDKNEKDPHYTSLDLKFFEKESEDNSGYTAGRLKKCDYTISGSFTKTGDDELSVKAEILDLFDGRREEISKSLTIRRAFQEMEGMDLNIKTFLMNHGGVTTVTFNASEEQALVFLDEMYAGKTPLTRNDIPLGLHEIKVVKDGFEVVKKKIEIGSGTREVDFKLEKFLKQGLLSVKSEPDEADVYLGREHLGVTPVIDVPVMTGMNRLRISREGFVDYLTGVNITKNKKTEISAKLEEGDTKQYFDDRKYVYQNYTYNDLTVYSFYSVLLFYAGYIYANLQANYIMDGLRPQISLVSPTIVYNSLVSTGQSLTPFYYTLYYESMKINETRRKASRYRSGGNVSAAGGGVMLVLGFVFMYMGIDEESLNIGMVVDPLLNESRSFVGYTQKF